MLKNRPSVTGWKAVYKTFAGVAAYISVASARAEICLQDASSIVPIVCDGLDPQFETPSSTASGFTVQVSNYDGSYSWLVSTTVGSATISGTGLITVTGLATAEGATVTVFTSKLNYTSQQSDVSGSATAGALVPNFATPTGTADGFTVQVTNYDESFTWSVSSAAGSPT